LTEPEISSLLAQISKLTGLKDFTFLLAGVQLTEKCLEPLKEFKDVPLTDFHLNLNFSNNFTDKTFEMLNELYSVRPTIRNVDLSFSNNSHLTVQGVSQFFDKLDCLEFLESLKFSFHASVITRQGLTSVAKAISHQKRLQEVVIYFIGQSRITNGDAAVCS